MSLTASAIRMLAEKGLSASDIADVAEANEPAPTSGAARQQRYRDRLRNERDVTRDVTPPPSLDKETSPRPPKENNPIPLTPTAPKISKPVLLPEHVLDFWNEQAGGVGLPKAAMTDKRRRLLACRIRENGVDSWTEAIGAVTRSPFCLGDNDRGWRANFDFLLRPDSITKLREGIYDRPSA